MLRSEVKCMAFSAAPVSVLLITLDRPSVPYSDHAVERAVLCEVGRRLLHEFAPISQDQGDPNSVWTDWDSVGRWAHGTFMVILLGVGQLDCALRAAQLRSDLASVTSPTGQSFSCSVAGATATPADSYEDLVACVDARMLAALSAGPNGLAYRN